MIDIEALKSLPNHIKVDLIDELLRSMDDSEDNEAETDEVDGEVIKEMERRLDDMKSGKNRGYTWQEAEAIWLQNIEKRKVYRA